MNKCPFCGGTLRDETVTFSYEEGDDYLLVNNIPAKVCGRCGKKVYSPEVTNDLMKFSSHQYAPVKEITIPVFDFARKH